MTTRAQPSGSNPSVSETVHPPVEFVQQVRDALRHLHDRTRLQTHPLARFAAPQFDRRTPGRGKQLQEELVQAIEALRPDANLPLDSPAGRTYQLLTRRYVEGEEAADVQRHLAIGKTEYYADHQRALDAITSLLWERWRPVGGSKDEPLPAVTILEGMAVGAVTARVTSDDDVKPRHNLPAPLTSFVGRVAEVATVADLLQSSRLVTLVGVGGCGKTRLALEVARDLVDSFPDGVWLVQLAPLADPALLPQAIALVVGIPEQPERPLVDTLTAALHSRRLVLVLDNCEHMIAACARLADDLLRACPTLRVLATSREALGIGGEVAWRVPSLSLPGRALEPASPTDALEVLENSEAARLFVDRARTAEPGFAVTAENVRAVVEICRRLDGIPLAIELAAARVKVLSVEQIAARLDDRFQLLTGGSRTALPRQQTLRAALDWSYHLLNEPEQALFRRLSVFAGGFNLQAAEAIGAFSVSPRADPMAGREAGHAASGVMRPASSPTSGETLDLISQLVDKSLVLVEKRHSEARYRMLETVRQYGHERLVESGEAAETRNLHAAWYLELAEQAVSVGLIGHGQLAWLDRLEVEHDNVRAALAWWRDRAPDRGIRLAGSMWRFWRMRGFYVEGREWLKNALERNPRGSSWRARALLGAGIIATDQGDLPESRQLLEESVKWWRQAGAKGPLGHALHDLGICLSFQGEDLERVEAIWDESLELLREVGDERGVACSLWFLGCLAAQRGDCAMSKALISEAIQIFRRVGDLWAMGQALWNLGDTLYVEGDIREARQRWEEQLELARRLGNRLGMRHALYLLARVDLLDHPERAEPLLAESLRVSHEIGSRGTRDILCDLGALAIRRGEHCRGVRLLSAGASGGSLRPSVSVGLSWELVQREWETSLAMAKSAMGDDTFASAWQEGQAMTLEQAVAYALAEDGR